MLQIKQSTNYSDIEIESLEKQARTPAEYAEITNAKRVLCAYRAVKYTGIAQVIGGALSLIAPAILDMSKDGEKSCYIAGATLLFVGICSTLCCWKPKVSATVTTDTYMMVDDTGF